MLPDIQLRSYPHPTKVSKYINKFIFSPIILHRVAGPNGRAVYGVGLRPLTY